MDIEWKWAIVFILWIKVQVFLLAMSVWYDFFLRAMNRNTFTLPPLSDSLQPELLPL